MLGRRAGTIRPLTSLICRALAHEGHAASRGGRGSGRCPGGADMFERDKRQVEPVQGGNLNALLGTGSRVTGTLVFEGPALIEGQIDGEITAPDTLTIGESAVVHAQITGT